VGWTVLSIQVPGFETVIRSRPTETFQTVHVPGAATSGTVGQPRLPVVRKILEIPPNSRLQTSVDGDLQTVDLAPPGTPHRIEPVQPPVPKLPQASKTSDFAFDAPAYGRDEFLPREPVQVTELGTVAGQRLVLVEVFPIRYNPLRGQLQVRPETNVRLDYASVSKTAQPLLHRTPREDVLLSRLTVNHVRSPMVTKSADAPRLLIVTPDTFTNSLTGFVTHKENLGWSVDLLPLSQAGHTAGAIRQSIVSRYTNLLSRPSAIVLVGDTAVLPPHVSTEPDSPDTDLYYACMDAQDDWLPELPIGRISVTDAAQLGAVLAKTITFETSAPAAWMSRAAFVAGHDNTYWTIAEGTHDWVITNFMNAAAYTSDRLYRHSFGAMPATISAAFNAGRAFGVYSGHGTTAAWWLNPEYFRTTEVAALANVGQYPFVTIFACDTGDYSLNECLAESWIRQAGKGAIQVLASSVTSFWDEDDILEREVFTTIYRDGIPDMGLAILLAKYRFLQFYGNAYPTRRYFEQYNLFGDPTLNVPGRPLALATPSPLPEAYTGEVYRVALLAGGGQRPYTNWSLASGQLPAGLSLARESGIISGTPSLPGTTTGTVQITDAWGASTTRVYELRVTARLHMTTSPTLPPASFGHPYSLNLSAEGGTPPFTWQIATPGDYVERPATPRWDLASTPTGWHGDDNVWQLHLPFAIPFYGSARTSLWVCSNGFVDFDEADPDYQNSDAKLQAHARIAVLWDDLDLSGGGVFLMTNQPDHVTIRWVGITYSGSLPVDFELKCYTNGTLCFDYGETVSTLTPTIGVSAGDGIHYTYAALNHASTVTPESPVEFRYRSDLPPGLGLTPGGTIQGTPSVWGTQSFQIRAQDSSHPPQTTTREFELAIDIVDPIVRFAQASYPVDESAGSITLTVLRQFNLPQPVTVDFRLADGTAAAGQDYLGNHGTLSIPAGAASATFDIPLVNDSLRELAKTFTVTLANPSSPAFIVAPSSAVVEITSDDDVFLREPFDSDPGWTRNGPWAFGIPIGQGGSHGNPDPTAGHSGSQVFGYNLAGDYSNDLSEADYLVAGPFNGSVYTNIDLVFWRWLGVEDNLYDHASLDVSRDGIHWTPVWQNPDSPVEDGAWTQQQVDLSGIADRAPHFYIRWGMGPTDWDWSWCGWNIDDVELRGELAVPPWWVTRAVLELNQVPNDFAAVNAGQLKKFVQAAVEEMDSTLLCGAGSGLHALTNTFSTINNYRAVNMGQLKNVVDTLEDWLTGIGLPHASPWTADPARDYAVANLGQLKQAFNLTFPTTFNPQLSVVSGAGPNGSVAPSGSLRLAWTQEVSFVASPASGYAVHQWWLDETVVQNGGTTFVLSAVREPHTVLVTFVPYAPAEPPPPEEPQNHPLVLIYLLRQLR
jgi:hypothetical protein